MINFRSSITGYVYEKNIRTPISFVDTEGGLTSRPEYFNFSIVTFDGFSNAIIIAVGIATMGCVNQRIVQKNANFYAEN